ncbi:unnamed protein product [Tuber aestivum]|uniref:Uncharacterized protein n=1 Tax=Tuber aestivum TaxID=59557 RepID=A0A292PZ91_9PEZI|nr:unnamed protein product [Tuber aestivum]
MWGASVTLASQPSAALYDTGPSADIRYCASRVPFWNRPSWLALGYRARVDCNKLRADYIYSCNIGSKQLRSGTDRETHRGPSNTNLGVNRKDGWSVCCPLPTNRDDCPPRSHPRPWTSNITLDSDSD